MRGRDFEDDEAPSRCGACGEWDFNCDCLFCPTCGDLVARDAAYHAAKVVPAIRFCTADCLLAFCEGRARTMDGPLAMCLTAGGRIRLECPL